MISGASRGLGAALAARFAAPGTLIGLIGRDAAALRQVASACEARGAIIRIGQCDVTSGTAMTDLLTEWDDAVPIDLAIANAGVTGGRQADGTMDGAAGARRLIEANLIGTMNLVEPLLPRFQARRSGQFALISSLAALRGMPDHPAYSASKAGVLAYGEGLRVALRPNGIIVSVILPGYFTSALDNQWSGPKPLAMSLDTMADRVATAIQNGADLAMIPRRLGLVLRALALLPSRLGDRLIAMNRLTYDPGEKK